MIAHNQPLYEALFLKEDSSFIRTLLRVVVLPGAKSLNQGYIFLLTVTAVQVTAAVQDILMKFALFRPSTMVHGQRQLQIRPIGFRRCHGSRVLPVPCMFDSRHFALQRTSTKTCNRLNVNAGSTMLATFSS